MNSDPELASEVDEMVINSIAEKSMKQGLEKSRSQSGFTLIELMIVVVIIGILASLAIPRFMSATTKQKQNECKLILKQIYVNQRAYRQENTTYWGNGISADSINTNNFAPLTVEIQNTAKYTYAIVATQTTFMVTATATGLDDDPANDVWTMNQEGVLIKVSDDSQL